MSDSSRSSARTAARPTPPREARSAAAQPAPVRVTEHVSWQGFLGGRTPTPVQAGAIPALLEGQDVITTARTGSGKTLAFLIPAVARGLGTSTPRGMRPEVLVVTPTRELAVQIRDVARELGLTAGRITGGITPGQTRSEASGKGLIAGTPGRLKDLIGRGELSLAGLRYVVLDEADELLSLGFLKDVGEILRSAQTQTRGRSGPHPLQIAMASATFPAAIRAIAEQFMHQPRRIDIAPDPALPGSASASRAAGQGAAAGQDIMGGATGATHLLINTTRDEVLDLAAVHAREALREPGGCVVIFCRTKALVKRRAERLGTLLPREIVSPLQGNMDQKKREAVMTQLRDGKSRVLIATDIAGRGIDLPEVRLVIHLDIASTAENHVHRSGRTARAGRPGTNLVLLIPEQRALWQSVRRALPAPLQPPLTPEEGKIDRDIQEKQGGDRGGSGRQGHSGHSGQGRSQSARQGQRGQDQGRPDHGHAATPNGRSQSGSSAAGQGQHSQRGQGQRPASAQAPGTGAGRVGPQRARRGRR